MYSWSYFKSFDCYHSLCAFRAYGTTLASEQYALYYGPVWNLFICILIVFRKATGKGAQFTSNQGNPNQKETLFFMVQSIGRQTLLVGILISIAFCQYSSKFKFLSLLPSNSISKKPPREMQLNKEALFIIEESLEPCKCPLVKD